MLHRLESLKARFAGAAKTAFTEHMLQKKQQLMGVTCAPNADDWEEFLNKAPAYISLMFRATCALLLLALLWATFAHLEEVTVGAGKVIPSSQVQVIQNLEGGIVQELPVKVGDMVKKGQPLLYIDRTRFASSADEVKAKNDALLARVVRLTAEASSSAFSPPAELLQSNPGLVGEERQLFMNRRREQEASLTVLRQQVNQRAQELQEKRARLGQLQESQQLLTRELSISKPLVAKGALSEVDILHLERQISDLKGDVDATRLAIPRIAQSVAEAAAKVDGQNAKYLSDTATELNLAKADLEQSRATSVAIEDRLARTAVRSPVAGLIKQMKVTTVGGVIQPGMDIMEVVPIEDNFLVEAKIRPADVAFIHPGQETTVKFSAYDFSVYGGLEATVENVTADSFTDDKGESYYLVRVRTRKNTLGTDKKLPIIPGMITTVHIQTGRKTILSYLLKPIIKAKTEALRER
jgi:membrane fusion protein, adhesin transport system